MRPRGPHCSRWLVLTLVALLAPVALLAQEPAEPLRARRNFLGMHNLKGGGVTPFQTGQDWTKTLVGSGLVMDWVTDYAPEAPNHWLKEAMDRDLVPTVRVQHCQPKNDPDCAPSVGYTVNVATQILDWKVQHPQYADRYVYMGLWNEPGDHRDYVPMPEYADYLVAAYAGIRDVERRYATEHPELDLLGTLMVVTPGQNGGWDRAFSHNPQAKYSFDVWGTHPYPDMTPPWVNIHDGDLPADWLKTVDSYIQDLDECAKTHNGVPGRRGFPVMITETNYGWFVGNSTEGWPKLTQEARATFMVDAFFQRWYQWPEILGVHPFLLNANAWPAFEFVHSWSSKDTEPPFGILEPANPLPIYTAVKQAREDHESRGLLAPARLSPWRGPVGHIRGKVTRADTGEPVPYATLYTDGYEFGHLTLFDGVYEIHDVPVGSYTLGFQKASHLPESRTITVRAGETIQADFEVTFTGKVREVLYRIHDRYGICDSACANQFAVDHWQAFMTGPDTGWIKFASAGIKGDDITMRYSIHEGGPGGPQVGPAMFATNPATAGDQIIGGEWPDGEEPAVQPSTPHWLHFQRADGQPIYCYASNENPYPQGGSSSSPGVDFYGTIHALTREVNVSTGTFAGTVRDADGVPLPEASVSRSPGASSVTSATDGGYVMNGVPAGTYDLTAAKPGYRSQSLAGQEVVADATTSVDFALLALPPSVGLSTSSLSTSTTRGTAAPGLDFTVQNTGGGLLSYTVSADAPWVSVTPASGTSSGEMDTLTVSLASANLAVGTHRATVTVSDPAAENSPQRVDVTLTVTPVGGSILGEDFESMPAWSSAFDASWGVPAAWSIVAGGELGNALQAARAGGGSSSRVETFSIEPNTDYTISLYMKAPSSATSYWAETAFRTGAHSAQDFDTNPGAWALLQKFSNSGTNGNGDVWREYSARFRSGITERLSVGFKLGSTGVGPGVQWDTLRVTADAPPPPAPPTIGLSPASLSAATVAGGSAPSQTFTVVNTGGGTLRYTIDEGLPWLSVTPSSGTSTGEADTVTVQYATAGLAPGAYAGAITVSDPAASNSPQTLSVTLSVVGEGTLGESFETTPDWVSSFDAAWGTPASWAIVGGGQSGNALQAARNSAGSSAKVLVFAIEPGGDYTLSVYMRGPASSSSYWAEVAYRLGRQSAADFDANAAAWTLVRKFSTSSENGNGNTWTRYAVTFPSGAASEISVGFKLGASGSAPAVAWDILRLETGSSPPPPPLPTNGPPTAWAVARPASGPAPLSVSYDGTGSSDPDGDSLSYRWDFGSGDVATEPSATRTYDTPGRYAATLTVSDGRGGSHSANVDVEVTSTPPPPGNGPNLVANPSFERSFSSGIAEGWQAWSKAGAGFWKRSSRLGRLGSGSYAGGGQVVTAVKRLNPKVILLEGNALGMATELRQTFPDALMIGRLYIDPVADQYLSDPERYGRKHAEDCLAANRPEIEAWQGLNEPFMADADAVRRVARFERAFSDRLQELGRKSVVFNLSVGNPGDIDLMLLPEVVATLATADYAGYHAYSSPADQRLVGPQSAWYAHRWRLYAKMYRERGLRMPPVVYTEMNEWYQWKEGHTPPGVSPSEPWEIRDDFIAFERESATDPWAVGIAIYLFGSSSAKFEGRETANEPVIYEAAGDHNWNHPADARDGVFSQQFGSEAPGFAGGVVQRVGVEPGVEHVLAAATKLETRRPGTAVTLRMGYDPTGQTSDGSAATIVWSDDLVEAERRETDIWYESTLRLVPDGPVVSIWLAGSGDGPVRVSLDDVRVERTTP